MPHTSRYVTWTLPQLREELRKRGAKISGRKKELIERLVVSTMGDNIAVVINLRAFETFGF